MTNEEMDRFKTLWTNRNAVASFCQNPARWAIDHKLCHLFSDIDMRQPPKLLYPILRNIIFTWVIGPSKCVVCGFQHNLVVLGWRRGWRRTCSKECQRKERSMAQMGSGNTSHKMSDETRSRAAEKQSTSMKNKVMSGYTPKSENYLTHGYIEFRHIDNTIRRVRSLWELIYWLEYPYLQYETVRVPYFCTRTNKHRIYIADFYDPNTNTIYEVKPLKYRLGAIDKQLGSINAGYNFEWVGEDRITKTPDMINRIKDCVLDITKVEKRLKWVRYQKIVKS